MGTGVVVQVAQNKNWINRSIFYLCRDFSSFAKGKEYDELEPVVHISILDFNPPDIAGRRSLYTKYRITDTRFHYVYSDIFAMNVLNLKYIDKVPEAERQTDLYKWASLFRARTWDDLKSAVKGVSSMDEKMADEFIFTMAKLSEDEKIQMACQAREDYEMTMRSQFSSGYKEGVKAMEKKMGKKIERIVAEKDLEIDERQREIENGHRELDKKDELIKELQAKIAASEKE
jgi:predicted transposase/invertase (TIGR01784 family)